LFHSPGPHRTRCGRESLRRSFPCTALRKCAKAVRRRGTAPLEGEKGATSPAACYHYHFQQALDANRMILKLKRSPGIYLVGFMGSGKSTIGRALADELGWNFGDLDADIEERSQSTISEIFDTHGETAFRVLETAALRDRVRIVESGRPHVISLGGGAFLN